MKILMILGMLILSLSAIEIAYVISVDGNVKSQDKSGINELKKGAKIYNGMLIITQKDSSVDLVFKDNSNLVIGENSLINIDKFLFKPKKKEYKFELFLEKGIATFESGKIGELSPESFSFKTPDGVVGIRGTKFIAKVE